MSYRYPFAGARSVAFGGIPASVTRQAATAALKDVHADTPEAALAVNVFAAAMAGDSKAFEAATKTGLTTVATLGATAACAATGVGAPAAPICGFIGGTIGKAAGQLFFPNADKETCGAARRRVLEAARSQLSPRCEGDVPCLTELDVAANRYAERQLGSCALTDNWSMAPTVRAEATRLGITLGKGETGVFGFAGSTWQEHARMRLASEAGVAILGAKLRRWDRDAAAARAEADAEYDRLAPSCPKPYIRRQGTLTPCEQKAADVAMTIASRRYVYATIDGAPAIGAAEIEALRRQFLAEVAQDRAIASSASAIAAVTGASEQASRVALSQRLRAAATSTSTSTMSTRDKVGLGLGLAALAGVVYVAVRSSR